MTSALFPVGAPARWSLRVRTHVLVIASAGFFAFLSCRHVSVPTTLNTGLPGTSTIRGRIHDDDGRPIAGAVVTLQAPALSGTRTATYDEEGFYHLPQLPADHDYTVSVEAPGYPAIRRPHVELAPFTTLTLHFYPTWRGCFEIWVPAPMIDFTLAGWHSVFQNSRRASRSEQP